MEKEKLKKYLEKRDFSKTSEPRGEERGSSSEEGPIFVVQKHDASNLHYDFRLEIEGVLVSWAIPKGPSLDPSVKRLAIPTEEHPLEYAQFEGVIPEGEYGAGTVMVWDKGTFENLKDTPLPEARKEGKLEIMLKGEKLKGKFVLLRTGSDNDGADGRWLLIKMKDDEMNRDNNILNEKPNSTLTGRSLEDIKKELKHQQ
ncbi:MAG: DNA ligase [Candidatus Nealsonbacteria bacterium]|nr:DNA ligase [Candidatus Nealsonbacteria bacterium]